MKCERCDEVAMVGIDGEWVCEMHMHEKFRETGDHMKIIRKAAAADAPLTD